jgi:sulfofructose kinase
MSDLRWVEGTRAAFAVAREAGVPTLLDADLGGDGFLQEFLCLADYAIFSGPALDGFGAGDDTQRLARVLALGVKHAGVTRGADGYTWATSGGETGHQPAFATEIVDTTGAGDAFHGAFAWALAGGHAAADCARIAAAVSALKCRRLGARSGLPTLEELTSFLKTH